MNVVRVVNALLAHAHTHTTTIRLALAALATNENAQRTDTDRQGAHLSVIPRHNLGSVARDGLCGLQAQARGGQMACWRRKA